MLLIRENRVSLVQFGSELRGKVSEIPTCECTLCTHMYVWLYVRKCVFKQASLHVMWLIAANGT